jgi:hypothetical protein
MLLEQKYSLETSAGSGTRVFDCPAFAGHIAFAAAAAITARIQLTEKIILIL